MSPAVIDVRRAEDGRDVVHRAVQSLVEGELVVFPTETVYGVAASALHEGAVEKLLTAKGRAAGHALSLAVKNADVAWDFVPSIAPVAKRLGRRCWPGPLTLVLPGGEHDSLLQQLSPAVRQVVSPQGKIGLRVPAHPLILDVLDLMAGPLALSSANRTGGPDPVTAADAATALGNDVRLILDDGPCRFGQPSTVLEFRDGRFHLLREGVVSRAALMKLAAFRVVLVCTGNTCRSPMAELLMRERLAHRLECRLDELEERGVIVVSAGSAATNGTPASPDAVEVMQERGLDLSPHGSRPISERLARDADVIFTMTRGHRHAIVSAWPDLADRTMLISPADQDIADPIGGSRELYRQCADQILDAVRLRVSQWTLDDLLLPLAEE